MNAVTKLLAKYERLAEIAHRTGAYACARKWSIKVEKLEFAIVALKQIQQEKAMELELVALVGSEKQIVWAEKIRQQFIKAYFGFGQESLKYEELTKKALAVVDSAKFWIDNRDYLEDRCEANLAKKLRMQVKPEQTPEQTIEITEQFQEPNTEMTGNPVGSEKQQTWAIPLRDKFINSVVACHCEMRGEVVRGERIDWLKSQDELNQVINQAAKADCKFWIDSRELGNKQISEKLLRVFQKV